MIEKLNGTTETVDFKVSSTTRLYHNHTAEDFPLHWHVPGEIICPIENTYQVTIAGQALTLLPHDVLIIASGELHSITAPPSGERYIVNFSNSFYEQFQELSLFFSTLHPYKLFRRADDLSGRGRTGDPAGRAEAGGTARRLEHDTFQFHTVISHGTSGVRPSVPATRFPNVSTRILAALRYRHLPQRPSATNRPPPG